MMKLRLGILYSDGQHRERKACLNYRRRHIRTRDTSDVQRRCVPQLFPAYPYELSMCSEDFSQCLTLLDPSNLDQFGGYLHIPRSGAKVNCFMKLRKEWLPMPDVGDVIILRSLRVDWLLCHAYMSTNFAPSRLLSLIIRKP